MPQSSRAKPDLKRKLAYIFLAASVVGLIASFVLTYDKLHLLNDPSYQPVCNINPILSCASVMGTEQATLLGLPNTIFGIMGFSMLGVIGLIILSGGVLKRWLWLVVNLGVLAGFSFAVYLFFQGVYRINAICPFCFLVWMILPPVLWYTTVYNLKEGNLKLGFIKPGIKNWIIRHHADLLVTWYVAVFLILLTHFWYYWKTLL